MEFLNEKSFSHNCRFGTYFKCKRSDFSEPIFVYRTPSDPKQLMSDVAEFIGFHATNIHPALNGFSGYDCLNFVFKDVMNAKDIASLSDKQLNEFFLQSTSHWEVRTFIHPSDSHTFEATPEDFIKEMTKRQNRKL